ncbi:MAG: GtrA family protein [Puniceicoccales bacterium]|jgi:putative flippase GtrA|nr:GtrA family protein [Puniceicoccales bacterium]
MRIPLLFPPGLPAWICPFARFAIIGVSNTAIHYVVLSDLVESGAFSHPQSNVCAFLLANAASYYANSHWSFEVEVGLRRYARFVTTSIMGVVISYAVMRFGDSRDWDYHVSFAVQVALMPLINFSLMRFLVFHDSAMFCPRR